MDKTKLVRALKGTFMYMIILGWLYIYTSFLSLNVVNQFYRFALFSLGVFIIFSAIALNLRVWWARSVSVFFLFLSTMTSAVMIINEDYFLGSMQLIFAVVIVWYLAFNDDVLSFFSYQRIRDKKGNKQ